MLVFIESPFRAKDFATRANYIAYARWAVSDSLARNESPMAFHLLYTQPGILLDEDANERALGLSRSHEWIMLQGGGAVKLALYQDFGVTEGMLAALHVAMQCQTSFEFRNLSTEIPPQFFSDF